MTTADTLFVSSLRRQAELMDQLALQEKQLQEAVLERNWDVLQRMMQQMTETSENLSEIEETRNHAYRKLSQEYGSEDNFSTFLGNLPTDVRLQISDAYRMLKVAVLRLKSQTNGIDTYLRSTIGTMRGVMRELYPEHATPVYSRNGTGSFTGGQALMVNHHQ